MSKRGSPIHGVGVEGLNRWETGSQTEADKSRANPRLFLL